MNTKITGNEQDYPVAHTEGQYVQPGLSIRQHYAGLAMQGMIASNINGYLSEESCASQSIKYADALITALNTPQTKDHE